MAISEAYAGSETVSTTEWSMTTDTSGPDVDTTDGIYQAFIDLNALAAGDIFEFRVYEKAQSGDTQRVYMMQSFNNAQGTDGAGWISPSFILINGWDMTLKKNTGTDRTITWSIRKVA